MAGPLTILAVGDVGVKRENPSSIFRGCREALISAPVTFGQLETTISERGSPMPHASLAMRAPPSMADAVADAGFDVMSFAGNHCLDWGYEAFDDTLRHMAQRGVRLCGAGADIAAAREPAIIESNGTRIALLAYSSILPQGYWAEANRSGCAPLRAHTVYEQIEHDQPGTPARIRTHAHLPDLDALLTDIETAKRNADLAIVSFHWGIHMIAATLADYQRDVARAAVAAGADAIVGHHPHILKGVEFIGDSPVFYSLGNFAIEQPHIWDARIVETASFRHLKSLNPGWDETNVYMLPDETRLTGVAKLVVRDGRIAETRFLPAHIADDSAPILLAGGDPDFERVRAYLTEINALAGLATAVAVDGDELVLEPSLVR